VSIFSKVSSAGHILRTPIGVNYFVVIIVLIALQALAPTTEIYAQDCKIIFKVASTEASPGKYTCGYLFRDNCNKYLRGSDINTKNPPAENCFSVTNVECLGHVIGGGECDLKLDILIPELKVTKVTFKGKNMGYGAIKFNIGFKIPGTTGERLSYDTYSLNSGDENVITITPYPLMDSRFGDLKFVYLKRLYTSSDNIDSKFVIQEIIIEYCPECGMPGSPDLTIESPFVKAPRIEPGANINILCDIVNDGDGATKMCHMKYYLSSDEHYDSNDKEIGYDFISSLSSGDISAMNKRLTLPPDLVKGTWYLLFYIDSNEEVDESNENNNISFIQLGVSTASASTTPVIETKEEIHIDETPIETVVEETTTTNTTEAIAEEPIIEDVIPIPIVLADLIVDNMSLTATSIVKRRIWS